jgi:serine/threonine protein phosphatase PrpC
MNMFELSSAMASDLGLKRQVNEDNVRIVHGVNGHRGLLAVVADGMGGHGHGDLASLLTVHTVAEAYGTRGIENAAALRAAVTHANRSVFFTAQQDTALRGMGTTCTALAIRDGAALCAHVGDSRLYLVRDGAIYTMTMDHSQVGDLVAKGLLTAAEAKTHRDRNVLLRALGTEAEVVVDCWDEPFPLRDGDRLLLCTDGLHGLVADEELNQIVGNVAPAEACRQLIALARARGGDDNITAAVVHVSELR